MKTKQKKRRAEAPAPSSRIPFMELRDRLRINKDDLDGELVTQAELLYHAGAGVALSTSRRDAAKDATRREQAGAAARAKRTLEKKGERPTAAAAEQAVESDPEVIAAREVYNKLSLEVERWIALRDAYTQRGWMLRELCSMQRGQQASPNSVRDHR